MNPQLIVRPFFSLILLLLLSSALISCKKKLPELPENHKDYFQTSEGEVDVDAPCLSELVTDSIAIIYESFSLGFDSYRILDRSSFDDVDFRTSSYSTGNSIKVEYSNTNLDNLKRRVLKEKHTYPISKSNTTAPHLGFSDESGYFGYQNCKAGTLYVEYSESKITFNFCNLEFYDYNSSGDSSLFTLKGQFEFTH